MCMCAAHVFGGVAVLRPAGYAGECHCMKVYGSGTEIELLCFACKEAKCVVVELVESAIEYGPVTCIL
jgi:hypothetical protein